MHHIFATAYTLFLSNTFISSARLKLAKKIKQGLDYSLSARALSSGGGVGCSGGVGRGGCEFLSRFFLLVAVGVGNGSRGCGMAGPTMDSQS